MLKTRFRFPPRTFAPLCLGCVGILASSGCTTGREFRQAALPAVHEGVALILNGVLDGVFSAIEVEPENRSRTR